MKRSSSLVSCSIHMWIFQCKKKKRTYVPFPYLIKNSNPSFRKHNAKSPFHIIFRKTIFSVDPLARSCEWKMHRMPHINFGRSLLKKCISVSRFWTSCILHSVERFRLLCSLIHSYLRVCFLQPFQTSFPQVYGIRIFTAPRYYVAVGLSDGNKTI